MNVAHAPDSKEEASLVLGRMAKDTANFFPYAKYRARILQDRALNSRYVIDAGEHSVTGNADGIGTKPELAERLSTLRGNPGFFRSLPFDVFAMVVDDAARFGGFVPAVYNNLDVNRIAKGDPRLVRALTEGIYDACKAGQFGLLDGETAELGYRTPGFGPDHLNWNAVALQLVNEKKIIDGSRLCPGQPIVALREKSIRSNGLTAARAIIQRAYFLQHEEVQSHRDFVVKKLRVHIPGLTDEQADAVFADALFNDPLSNHVHAPWHEVYPDLTEQLLTPSKIYAPLIYAAQGGVDGEVQIPLVACQHVSGGGIPTKGGRMVTGRGVGLVMDPVFEDPAGIPQLISMAQQYGYTRDGLPFDDRMACEQWNRGIGFMCVTEDQHDAARLILLARDMGYEADWAGEITDQPDVIQFRGHIWRAAA